MDLQVFFQLVRWKNLLLGTATLSLLKFVLMPNFEFETLLSNFYFVVFLLAIVFISAAGYIINDLFDVNSDKINKPNKVIIGRKITVRQGKILAVSLSIIGFFCGVLVSEQIKKMELSVYFFGLILLLYYYSKKLKSIVLLGNISVALLISSSIYALAVFEGLQLNSTLSKIFIIYTIFAFHVNLIREIIKDIEDLKGDNAVGIKTLPILIGRKRTNNLSLTLSILLSIFLVVILTLNRNLSEYIFLYGLIFVLLPVLYLIIKLNKAKLLKDYTEISSILKIIMLLGILSIFAF